MYNTAIFIYIVLELPSLDIKIALMCANYRSTDSNPTKEMYFDCRNARTVPVSTIFLELYFVFGPQ